jgi:hypothetical protein
MDVSSQLLAQDPNLTAEQQIAAIRSRLTSGGAMPVQAGDTGQYFNGNGQQLQNPQAYVNYSNNALTNANNAGMNVMSGGSAPFSPSWGAAVHPASTQTPNQTTPTSQATAQTPTQTSGSTPFSTWQPPATTGPRQADFSIANSLWNSNNQNYQKYLANALRNWK